MKTMQWIGCALALLAVAGLTGCLERKEKIKINADGSAEIVVTIKGDPEDIEGGDPMPTEQAGWRVRDDFDTDSNGKRTQTREGILKIARGGEWPSSYAAAGTEDAEIGLRFPTGLMIETRPDGTYYHFHRVYQAREHARFEYVREQLQETLDKMGDVSPDQYTQEQREKLVDAIRQYEAAKQLEFTVAAARAMNDWSQDRVLKLRQAVANYFDAIDVHPLAQKLGEPESESRDREIAEFSTNMVEDVRTALVNEMQSWGLGTVEQEQLLAAHARESARRMMTEDIGDEHFTITIQMPGEIVAHNGEPREDGEVQWTFPGKALMDRNQEIMVTSRVIRKHN